MKSCSVCKTLVGEHEKFCTFCGNKIQTLSEFFDKTRDEVLGLSLPEDYKINKIGIQLLSCEIEKFMKFRIGSILILIFIALCVIFGFYIQDEYAEYRDYKAIQENLSNNEYQQTQVYIDKFLYDYVDSSHRYELIRIKDEISHQVEMILAQQKTKDYLKYFDKIGESVSMGGDMVLRLYGVTDTLGMDKEKIKIIDFFESQNYQDHDYCIFVYRNHYFTAYYGDDNEIFRVRNSLNEDMFLNNQVEKSIYDFLLSDDEIHDVMRVSKMIVNLVHDDPTISKFPDMQNQKYYWNMMKKGDTIVVLSHVSYVNNMNQNIKENFQITLNKNETRYELLDLILDGKRNNQIIY